MLLNNGPRVTFELRLAFNSFIQFYNYKDDWQFFSLSQLTYPEDAILHISICRSNRESSFPGEIYEGG